MNCPKHPQQRMVQLFTSYICDLCDPPKTQQYLSAEDIEKLAYDSIDYTRKQPIKKAQDWSVDLGRHTIMPGATLTIIRPFSFPFRGEGLISQADRNDLEIVHIFVGSRLQFPPNTAPIPVTNYNYTYFPGGQKLDVVQSGLCISFHIRNTGKQSRVWSMAIKGKAVFT